MVPRTTGRLVAVGIVVFWVTMTWQLLRREVFLPRLDMSRVRVPSPLRAGAGSSFQEDWHGIYYKDTKVGYMHTTISRLSSEAYTLRSTAELALRLLERDMSVQFDGTATVGPDGTPERLLFDVRAGPARLQVRGQRRGETLDLQVVSAGRVIHKAVPIRPGLTLSNAVTPSLYWPEMEPGKTYTLDVLDPLSLSTRLAKVRVRGREPLDYGGGVVEATVLEFDYNGLTFLTWMSDAGIVLRQESDLGWYLVREDAEHAQQGIASGSALGEVLQDFASIRSDHRFRDSQSLTFMRARLDGIGFEGLTLTGAHQRLLDPATGTVEIVRNQPSAARTLALPITDPAYAPYLATEPFIQSDDPEIIATARRIIGGETNSWRAAELIGGWVYNTLEKDLLAGIPSAVEILETQRGDCNEHTTLFTALARSVGIPTRYAVGVVYNEGRYYYHAWPEVYVGQWIATDPTFGQATADATHIKLIEGDLSRQAAITRVMGKLEIRVLADSEDAPALAEAS